MNSIETLNEAKLSGSQSKIKRARNLVVAEYFDYCKKITVPWAKNNPELAEDLHQAALMGLTIAMNRYDVEKSKGAKFMTFAYRHILERVVECVNKGQEIKISDNKKRLIPTVVRFIKAFQEEHKTNPSFEQIAAETEIHLNDIRDIVNIHFSKYSTISLNAQVGKSEENRIEVSEVIAAPKSDDFVHYVETNVDIVDRARNAYKKLSTNQLNVFSLLNSTTMDLRDASKMIGLGYERTRQINKEAMRKLFKPSDSFFLEKYSA